MPKRLHRALARSARRKGLKGTRRNRYIYGAMNRIERGKKRKKRRRR